MKPYIQAGEKKLLSHKSPADDINTYYIPEGVYIMITGISYNRAMVCWQYYDKVRGEWFSNEVTVCDKFTEQVAQETIKLLIEDAERVKNENKN